MDRKERGDEGWVGLGRAGQGWGGSDFERRARFNLRVPRGYVHKKMIGGSVTFFRAFSIRRR